VAPQWHELGVNPNTDTTGYTLHCKDVKPLDQQALIGMAANDLSVRDYLIKALAWINDERLYVAATSEELERSTLPSADIDLQLARGKIEFTKWWKGTCKTLRVPEHAKRRFRAIQHPKIANDRTEKPEPVRFTSTNERHAAVLRGKFVLSLDFAAFFDQFLMSPEVRKYFAFTVRGRTACMRVMPMGLKHSVGVAQAATLQLLNFPTEVYTEAYVDNVRFIHDDVEAILDTAAQFVGRCLDAGVTINEIDVSTLAQLPRNEVTRRAKDMLRPLIKSKEPWLGEMFDYVKKEVSLTDRTKEKVAAALEQQEPTFRNLAARFGILLYASRTLGMKLSPYFPARRAMQTVGRLLSTCENWWDSPAPPLCDAVVRSMRQWRDDVLRAPPKKVEDVAQPQLVLITDASASHWGTFAFDEEGHEGYTARLWTTADHATGFPQHSARAEPEAVLRAAYRWVRPTVHRVVHIVTDSSTAVGALGKGHSSSFHVNSVCARLNETYPGVRFLFTHVPGKLNPADGISRGALEPSAQEWDQARRIADTALETRTT
jgi:hypothetical protein